MTAALKEVLRNTLDDLKQDDFKRFKHNLHDRGQIPWVKLENADRCDIVESMVETYRTEAGDIVVTILQKLKNNQLAMDLERELRILGFQPHSPGLVGCVGVVSMDSHDCNAGGMATSPTLTDGPASSPLSCSFSSVSFPQQRGGHGPTQTRLKLKLQEQLKNRFCSVHQESGDYRLQDIYTDLYIVEGRTGGAMGTHEVSTLNLSRIGRGTSSEDKPVRLANMFTDRLGTKILTLGIAGVGKTVAVQKFVMDWADNQTNQDIDFVFVLLFRELNLRKKKKCYSLLDLLLVFYTGIKGLKTFSEFSECKILFILDGLDESRLQLDFGDGILESESVCEVGEVSSVDVIITSLIKGTLLPSALIWVTTRPAAASLIPRNCFNLVVEVRGFNDPQKIEFFQKNVKDPVKANKMIDHVNSNRCLHIMCHIPVFCRILAKVLEDVLEDLSKGVPPKSLTEIYAWFSIFQVNKITEKYAKKMSAKKKGQLLIKLGKLAFKHLEKGTLIFYKKDLKKCKINAKSGALESGVCTQIFKKESGVTGQSIFSFIHLSVQEFLAALYVLHRGMHQSNPFLKKRSEKLHWLFKSSRFDLYKSAVENALDSRNGHLDLFIRFLLGLAPMVEPEIQFPLDTVLPQLAGREMSIRKTIQFVKEKIREDVSPERIINLFHCLNELGDNSLVQEINRYRNSAVREGELTPAQCSALTYLMLMSAEDLDEFDLKKYLRSEQGLHRMLPVVQVSVRVWLNKCHLSKASGQLLASVLQGTSSPLRELDMSDNDLQDEGVELLCVGLRHPQCKLDTLRLSQCHLSKASCEMMASVLQGTSSPLRELDMSDNDLQDEGVELLCVGLRHPQCKLETLRIRQCHLSKASCEMMASVLQGTSSPLRELDTSDNDLQDEGVELLCVGLRHPQCKLDTLRISWCNLSKESCEKIMPVLQKTSFPLRELDMSDNDLQDEGVELLCVGLRHPQCKLETLRLPGCLITYEGCSFLASALKSNPSYLKQLDLSYNHPEDSGVRELTDMLNDPNCKLETVRHNYGGQHRINAGLRKYACGLTLDPNTANRRLCLSEGNRKVTRVSKKQPYPDHPDRFDSWEQVLCREGLSGRCYWEAECSGDGAEIAAAYKSIQRKGEIYSRFECNDQSWSLSCYGDRYCARHNNTWADIPASSFHSSRVGVYLDWPAGTLSFYSVSSDTLTHLHTFHSTFTQPLYPGFRCNNSVTLCWIT